MQKHSKQADSANGTQRSKVIKAESFMIEKEASELKHKDFVIALYLTGMHGNKTKELACLLRDLFALENSASVRCICMWAKTNLDNYVSVIYNVWFLEIQRTPGHGLELGFS